MTLQIGGTDVAASGKPGDSKLLSIILTGRDDDYMPDFKYRITTTINYIARNLHQLGRLGDVEILVTDWGSRTPMAQTLHLSPEAGEICRFLYVPPSVVCAAQNGVEAFHISLATNAGLRRGRGAYLMIFGADTLLPEHTLESILVLLGGKPLAGIAVDRTYFLLSRYHVPYHFVRRQPTLIEWDRYLVLHAGEYEREQAAEFSISSGAGALMMHQSLWHELRGLDERLGGWGMNDVDLGLRVTQRYPWIELSCIGVSMFHMAHPLDGVRADVISKGNPCIYNSSIQANDDGWGLGSHNFELQRPQILSAEEGAAESRAKLQHADSRKVESWDQSHDEILEELESKGTRNHVGQIARLAARWEWKIDSKEMCCLFLLSWYSRRQYPRRYLEFGTRHGYAAAVVTSACPSVEVYSVNRWEGSLERDTPFDVVRVHKHTAHQGYIRFINGDVGTAVHRLQDSFVGLLFFDLILVRGDHLVADSVKQIRDLFPHLSSGGALVFTCGSVEQFMAAWNEIRAGYPQFTYIRCENRGAGMILKASLRGSGRDGSDDVCRFETGWVELSVAKWYFGRWFFALLRPHMYLTYSIRALEWLKRKWGGSTSI